MVERLKNTHKHRFERRGLRGGRGIKMLAHPVTGHIVRENDYGMILDWHRIQFIKLDDCKLMEADGEFKKVGICEGKPFESVLTHEDYFGGKFFIYQIH